MEFFHKAKLVRLRSHQHQRYLLAHEDRESVRQEQDGLPYRARWAVEFVPGSDSVIRLKSCYDKYLTASNQPLLIGLTGRQVLQTLPARLDSSVEWEPIKNGNHMRLRSRHGDSFLRANGGPPPWRKTVTHFRADGTPNSDLEWDVEILEMHKGTTSSHIQPPPPHVHVNGNAPAPASGNGNNFYEKYGRIAVGTANLGVDLTKLMLDDAKEHAAGVADAIRVSDATGVVDLTGVADATIAAAGGIDVGDLAEVLVNVASNCTMM